MATRTQRAIAARVARGMVRCERCLGMGYKGRYRQTARGRAWKIETCRGCGGTGEREYARQRGATVRTVGGRRMLDRPFR